MSATIIRIMQSVTLTIIVAIAIMLININKVTTDVNNNSMMTVIFFFRRPPTRAPCCPSAGDAPTPVRGITDEFGPGHRVRAFLTAGLPARNPLALDRGPSCTWRRARACKAEKEEWGGRGEFRAMLKSVYARYV